MHCVFMYGKKCFAYIYIYIYIERERERERLLSYYRIEYHPILPMSGFSIGYIGL